MNDYGICSRCEDALLFCPDPGRIEGTDGFTSPLLYNDTVRSAMLPFKYHRALYKKEFLVHHIALDKEWAIDCFAPVPLHPSRQRERGYNQSEVLAVELSKKYGFPVRTDLLFRLRDTPQQAKMGERERRKNVKGAFRAAKECEGLSIALVDDVRTTGSTLRECALELKKSGAARVYAITACCSMEEVRRNE